MSKEQPGDMHDLKTKNGNKSVFTDPLIKREHSFFAYKEHVKIGGINASRLVIHLILKITRSVKTSISMSADECHIPAKNPWINCISNSSLLNDNTKVCNLQ
jgi:hypothetical protein